jgi:lipopolysaccharide export system protein LptA
MRRTRRVILVLIVAIVVGVWFVYDARKTTQARNTPDQPAALPEGVGSSANRGWIHSPTKDGLPTYEIRATNYRMSSDGNRVELEGVTLKLFTKDAKNFDEVKSAKADFDTANGVLVSQGEVEITRGIETAAVEASKKSGKLMVIRTSGVSYESKTGKVWTEKPASFKFNRGEGASIGAAYDPETRELHMRKDVQLKWFASAKPMEIQTAALVYREAESQVWLLDWSKFKRDTLSMDGGPATVNLVDGAIRSVEASNARGVDTQKERTVEYSANRLEMKFTDKGAVEDVVGDGSAKLVSTTPTTQTSVTSNRLDLDFELAGDEAQLKKALATGNGVIESRPILQPKIPPPDTRFLRSEVISMHMRPGGEEIAKVQAEARGVIEFMPNRPGQKKRRVDGDGITIEYGAGNKVQSFTATSVTTRTEPEPIKGKPPQPPAITSSKGMAAQFDPQTGAMSKLEQWDDFKYQEGERQAKADRATLEQVTDLITLSGAARVWDPTGSTAAKTIVMAQKTGDVRADGDVTSTRLPEKKKGPQQAGAMLASDEPLQAKAARMTSSDDNRKIRYEGNALMWQGSNRIEADRIDIDRASGVLEAHGNVTSQLLDKAATEKQLKQKKGSVFTIVKAAQLVYRDKEQLAHYTGGVVLTRSSMVMNSQELRAFLKQEEKGGGSSLDHAFADGSVKIVDTTPLRVRTGVSEHAEYFVPDAKIILNGGDPTLTDSLKGGSTKGRQLTYFSDSDKLIVEGAQDQPVKSRILKK